MHTTTSGNLLPDLRGYGLKKARKFQFMPNMYYNLYSNGLCRSWIRNHPEL